MPHERLRGRSEASARRRMRVYASREAVSRRRRSAQIIDKIGPYIDMEAFTPDSA
jgi:hypothetical protein